MGTVEILLDLEEIKKLKARYFFAVDTRKWDEYAGVFTADAHIDFTARHEPAWVDGPDSEFEHETSGWIFTGGSAVAEWAAPLFEGITSVHHGHDPQIEFTSPDTATGIWAMSDRLETSSEVYQGFGHYLEEYRREEGRWRISRLVLTRLLEVVSPRADAPV